ncbi:MAG: proline dehydrogenase family protein [Kineosporiaceae bacterium]|nr:proline dehydrogenase family protein [Kineosporiaceae bacterium]MBK7623985.1 proline dehydrogenase family protein [Kineosporiaceae bacterium]MBK8075741.1 proline dehydrogenase family protein [Kineosporiaceae bacterium]
MLRGALLQAAQSRQVRELVETTPVSRSVVRRYVPGTEAADAVNACHDLVGQGLNTTLDHLGEDTVDIAAARAVRDAYRVVLEALSDAGLTEGGRCEVSVKLSAIGQALGSDGEKIALEHAHEICAAAAAAGTTVTLDMEDHTTVDSTLSILRELRRDYPWVGAVLQAYLYRTEGDCVDLAHAGSRVRLCKGAYAEPESVAYASKKDVDLAYVRCARTLMAGAGYPMLATHDPRLIDIGNALAVQNKRQQGTYEFQMLYGIRPEEQRRLASDGETMRVYVPYGTDWYGYFMRRLAERPANVSFFLRSLLTKS